MRATFPHIAEVLSELNSLVHKSHRHSPEKIHLNLSNAVKSIRNKHPYEPLLWHSLDYLEFGEKFDHVDTLRENLFAKLSKYRAYLETAKQEAITAGILKISQGSVVVTRGDYPLVRQVLSSKEVKAKKINLHIVGKPDNKLISKFSKGKVTVFEESALRQSLKDADLLLLGCSVITPHHIVGEMGSELLAELAHKYQVPVYIVALGLQYDLGWEKNIRKIKDFKSAPVSQSRINKYVAKYEFIEPTLVNGIISELGVYSHHRFCEQIVHNYPWIFRT